MKSCRGDECIPCTENRKNLEQQLADANNVIKNLRRFVKCYLCSHSMSPLGVMDDEWCKKGHSYGIVCDDFEYEPSNYVAKLENQNEQARKMLAAFKRKRVGSTTNE